MNTPEISCVVPTYGNLDLVARCLLSLAAQREVALEIIVTDDSPDHTVRDLVQALPGLDGRARCVEGPRSGNPVENWNSGLALARAPFCVVVHQDEFLVHPLYLRRAVDALNRTAAAAAQGRVAVIGVDRPSRFALVASLGRLRGARRLLPMINWIGPTAAFVFRAGWRFDPAMVQLADVEFYGRVLKSGPLVRLPGVSVGSLGHHGAQITARIDPTARALQELSILATRTPPALSPLEQAVFSAALTLRARLR